MNCLRKAYLCTAFGLLAIAHLYAQPVFKYGFGVGVNFSNIAESETFPIFEDISGAEYATRYAPFLHNFGNQYFFHGELWFDNNIVVALKPGNYTAKFSKTDDIVFNTETIQQESNYLLRYINIPLEIKYLIGNNQLQPFLGGYVAYGHLLPQGRSANHSFIRPKIVIGPSIGAYYGLNSFDLVLTAGYDFGMHTVTKKSDRYSTGTATPYSQSNIKLNTLHISLSALFSVNSGNGGNGMGALECPKPRNGRKARPGNGSKKLK